MGWILLAVLVLIVLGNSGPHVVYLVSARDLERRSWVDAIPALAVLFLAVTWVVVLVAPAWLWSLTGQGAALWFGLAHWRQVTVAGYSVLAALIVLGLAWAMLATLDCLDKEKRT